MPRELIAPGREQVAFRDYAREPLASDQIRVRSLFGAAKHGTEMSMYLGYGSPRGAYDKELGIFTSRRRRQAELPDAPGEYVRRRDHRDR